MKTLLISYDLVKPESSSDYLKLFSYLKEFKYWAKPLKSVWLIKTNKKPLEVAKEMTYFVDSNDKFTVIECASSWAGFRLSDDVIKWMQTGL